MRRGGARSAGVRSHPALLALLLATSLLAPSRQAAADEDGWHRVIGILQYLEADYPAAIESQSEAEMEEQRAFIADVVSGVRELGEPAASTLPKLEALKETIERGEDPDGVSKACGELIEKLAALGGVVRSPRNPPDLKHGAALYAQHCASCHAADGSADIPLAATMSPPPANFHDAGIMGALSPYKAFNTIGFGVPGTAMPGFPSLNEADRWSLAFFVHTLRQPLCTGGAPRLSVRELAASSDDALVAAHGADALACLRRELPRVDPASSLLLARTGVKEALRMASSGDPAGARKRLVDVYLGAVEPVELLIQTHDRALVQKIEAAFLAIRFDLEGDGKQAQRLGLELISLLDRAEEVTVPASASVAFWGALVVILREGFEAMIVIAALLAVLKRMKQPALAKIVHAGWASAFVLGAIGFVLGGRLLARFNPELVEGIAALVAVGMLIYHTIWLSARAHVAEYMRELRDKMESALGRGSAWGLFVIAFTAVLRESLEVVLFLQGLSIDSPAGVAWGSAAGLLALLAMVVLVNRVGYKLPMKALFRGSTIVLFATAVVLLGKGIHALQIVGLVPLRPAPLFTIDLLGIYPDAVSLGAQVCLAVSPLVWRLLRRKTGRRTEEPAAV